MLSGLPETEGRARCASYGYNLGMAFQIVDDILDFTGDESSLGKPAGSDLLQGTLTLPFFHYLQQHPDPEQLSPPYWPVTKRRKRKAMRRSGMPK